MKNRTAALFGLMLVAGCGHMEKSVTRGGEIKQTLSGLDDDKFIRTRGIGAAPTNAKDSSQAKGMSRNAGLVAARYEMLQRLRGLRLNGGLTVAELIQTDSRISEQADDIVRGAEEVSTEFAADGGAVVVLQVRRSEIEKLTRGR